MVKPLVFKGDKPKKRKRTAAPDHDDNASNPAASSMHEARPSKALATPTADDTRNDAAEDDSWVSVDAPSELAGPVLLLLPTEPISCLATDAHGAIFASRIEHLPADADPYASATPHDVRQVWIASRAAGASSVSFKGNNGRFLGADAAGAVHAAFEAVGPEECWDVAPVAGHAGGFALQGARGGFLAVCDKEGVRGDDEVERRTRVRGDAERIDFGSTLRLRMQARFKPRGKRDVHDKALAKISRRELEDAAGRRLEDDEVKTLRRARRQGDYHETLLDLKKKGKHDKFA